MKTKNLSSLTGLHTPTFWSQRMRQIVDSAAHWLVHAPAAPIGTYRQ